MIIQPISPDKEGDKILCQVISGDIRQDPFVLSLLSKISPKIAQSFSDEQLTALKMILGSRQSGYHKIDIRGQLSFWRWRYYYVILGGINRRPLSRRQQEFSNFGSAVFFSLLIIIATLFGLLALYLIKSALGIDIFPGLSLGIWSWFRSNFL